MNISSFLIGYQAGKNAGGGSSADVRYVTFMSYDGSVEYGKKAVAVGDDCADPIKRGVFNTPTRESDVQYNYTFAGWATTPHGGLDSNALKAVTEDRTVYANYISALRSYTITYYDGNTKLKSEILAYGTMPAYKAEKDGYSFDGWEPALATVTGDASYYAKWQEKVTFAGSSWADISRICEAGEAENYFAIGDSRVIPLTKDGTTYNFTAKIVGLNHDTKASGGKAGISCLFYTTFVEEAVLGMDIYSSQAAGLNYTKLGPYEAANAFMDYVPSELASVIKPVVKKYNVDEQDSNIYEHNVQTWIPAAVEVNPSNNLGNRSCPDIGVQYTAFKSTALGYSSNAATKIVNTEGTAVNRFWLRDMNIISGGYGQLYQRGATNSPEASTYGPGDEPVVVGFCI